jgi:saccharopine dehydrogenase (NAD+, L-lysine forming)
LAPSVGAGVARRQRWPPPEDPGRRLTVISDVTCDVTSVCNMLSINDRTTTWSMPARRLCDGPPPLDIIAIDNLPALLPREASIAFSADLRPHLASLGSSEPWQRCGCAFHGELARAG